MTNLSSALHPTQAEIDQLVSGTHRNPHSLLGAHESRGETIIRTLRPHALAVSAVVGGQEFSLTELATGLFATSLPVTTLVDYRLLVTYPRQGSTETDSYLVAEGYRFLPTLGEIDLHLIHEGRHERLWEVLGAHRQNYRTPDGLVHGVSFAVWAPAAQGIAVIGDFNGWNGSVNPMRCLGSSGVWELFIPDISVGELYKYQIHNLDGSVINKADPMAFATEIPPATASKVYQSSYDWKDQNWIADRATRNPLVEPMSTFEVHLGSWKPGLTYRELSEELTKYVVDQGFTHVELLPFAEHPYGGSWGYQVTSYFAPTARFGTPDELKMLIDSLHRAGIGVIVDWVPAHFPKDFWALARFDGSALYEHANPQRGEQPDWGTYVFDFGRPEVRNFLVANALFWIDQFHIDGLRVDAVASMLYLDYSRPAGEWTPNIHGGNENLEAVQFLQEMNATVHKNHPGVVTIAEESTSWPGVTKSTHVGGLGFSMKWNMGWMHDTLSYCGRDPIHRSYHHNQMTFS
ncbi:MAG: 1,4-alpha-glucan branching enzyme, partial [Mycobacteriaceae bacterium]